MKYNQRWGVVVLSLCLLNTLLASPGNAQNVVATIANSAVNAGSFEAPDIPAGSFQYTPAGSGWALAGPAAIADNGSAFTNCNPAAPAGTQVLVLQQTASAHQTVNLATAGTYRLSIRVAQRGCSNSATQAVRLLLNGAVIGLVRPANGNYQTYTTAAYSLAAGSHTLRLEGTDASGDNSAMVDNLQWQLLPRWSQPSTWQGGAVPGSASTATIPAGFAVAMDVANCTARVININGTLTAPLNLGFGLSTECVHVLSGGVLEIGQEGVPYFGTGKITLVGNDPNSTICGAMGAKFIGGMSGSRIDLHGAHKTSWSQLGATANAGATTITLKEPVAGWAVGNCIVIASTDFDMNRAEERTITAVSADQRTFTLNAALSYRHFGQLQTYSSANGQSWTVDERGEVGMLTRNLVVEGDAASTSIAFGGHIMVMAGSFARASNIELNRMGQRGRQGRYPFHWHLVGNGAGQYFANNSIHHTFNRALTLHSTSNTTVRDNVFYDNPGHALFVEDGNETGNIIIRNLGLVTRKPDAAYALLESDRALGRNATGPSTFWITHPNNIVQNNRAGGSDGSGFWFAFHQNPNSPSFVGGLNPNVLPLPAGYIDGNTAHSSVHGWLVGMAPVNGDASLVHNPNNDYTPPTSPTITGLTVYKNQLGVYSRIGGDNIPSTYVNMIAADNREGEANTWVSDLRQCLWVGASQNYEPIAPGVSISGHDLNIVTGHTLYDGPARIYNSHFAGFDRPNFSLFDQWGANVKYHGHALHNTTVAPGSYNVQFRNNYVGPVWFNASIMDVDGVFTGRAMTAIHQDHPVLMDGTSRRITAGLRGVESNRRFCYIEVRPSDELFPVPAGQEANRRQTSELRRSDGAGFVETVKEIEGVSLSLVVNGTYQYRYLYHRSIPAISRFDYHSMNAGEWVIVEIPNVPSTANAFSGTPTGFFTGSNLAVLPRVASLAALQTYNGNAAAYIGNSMYIRFQAPAGTDFRSRGIIGSLFLCLYGACANGGNFVFPDGDGDGLSNVGESLTGTVIRRNDADVNDMSFDFTDGNGGDWVMGGSSAAYMLTQNLWFVRADGPDPQIIRSGMNMNGNQVKYIDVRTMCQAAGNYQLYWTTDTEGFFSEAKSVTVNYPTANTWQVLRFDVGDHPLWRGRRITGLRIDPIGGNAVHSWYDWIKAKNTWLYALNKQGGSSTTLQRFDGGGNDCRVVTPVQNTAQHTTGATWVFDLADWNNDGYTDMVGFNRQGTGTGTTEVHVLNGKTNYQDYLFNSGTGLGYMNLNDHLALGDYNGDGKADIWFIPHNATGSNMTEVHVLDGNNPQAFLLNDATGLGLVPNTGDDFKVHDYDNDGRADLWYIKKTGTGTGKTELHILRNTGDASTFNNFSLHVGTALGQTDANWSFDVADYNRDGAVDLIAINRAGSNGRTDVHILNGAANFQNFLLQVNTDAPTGTANHVYLLDDGARATGLGYAGAPAINGATPLGLPATAAPRGIHLQPNPASDQVLIDMGQLAGKPVKVILTPLGSAQQVLTREYKAADAWIKLPLHTLANGIYLLRLQPANGPEITEKLVIAH
jgi:hypothetical protein